MLETLEVSLTTQCVVDEVFTVLILKSACGPGQTVEFHQHTPFVAKDEQQVCMEVYCVIIFSLSVHHVIRACI